ncbi:hypothetical protein EYF80_058088 [Liparis tanakae]|uniref:Uncharacterized protein n=1 Tax=Liparis tanakae TaxID=230148 RepID=A0A4Z2ES52_9TELE|nr:hypothetical protein EYF80_058088 [Liparis tanakae]
MVVHDGGSTPCRDGTLVVRQSAGDSRKRPGPGPGLAPPPPGLLAGFAPGPLTPSPPHHHHQQHQQHHPHHHQHHPPTQQDRSRMHLPDLIQQSHHSSPSSSASTSPSSSPQSPLEGRGFLVEVGPRSRRRRGRSLLSPRAGRSPRASPITLLFNITITYIFIHTYIYILIFLKNKYVYK